MPLSATCSTLKQVNGKIGTVGYCMGGGLAMRTAAAEPGKVQAAASFHGSQLASDAPDSPHTLAPRIKAQMYFGFAIEDRTMPPEAVEKLKSALNSAGVNYEGEVFAGARHGWCVKDHTVYHEHQAEHALAPHGRTLPQRPGISTLCTSTLPQGEG
jgi:carboxymethylenebutenolidase